MSQAEDDRREAIARGEWWLEHTSAEMSLGDQGDAALEYLDLIAEILAATQPRGQFWTERLVALRERWGLVSRSK